MEKDYLKIGQRCIWRSLTDTMYNGWVEARLTVEDINGESTTYRIRFDDDPYYEGATVGPDRGQITLIA